MVNLRLKVKTKIPITASCISPDVFYGKSKKEIKKLEVFYGNKQKSLGELFEISGEDSDIVMEGDFSRVKQIGSKMTCGKILIKGDCGMHLGSYMKGGEILVEGNVSDWCGAEMRGGFIRIKGNAGNLLGAAYRGSKWGMNRGTIIVEGNALNEVGIWMKRGIIVVLGDVGNFAGAHMKGGTIISYGKIGERVGAEMNRGTIIAFKKPELLPTFKYDCTYNPSFLRFFLKELSEYGIPVKREHITGLYERYNGDFTELSKGEVLVFGG
ncbi:MAG: formylmethanofuran dehydrogenase subunit C [Candidatus Methanofastidiosia archaeon]